MSIKVTINRLSPENVVAIQEDWLQLEGKIKPSVFLTWGWISSWISIVEQPLILVKAVENNEVIGLGLLVESTRKLLGLFPITQWHLHRCGNSQQDQMWIEYNDFLTLNKDILAAMVAALKAQPCWDELIVGMSDGQTLAAFKEQFRLKKEVVSAIGYKTRFCEDWQQQSRSRNTRQKINKNIRMLEQEGEITFSLLQNPNEIQACMADVVTWHIQRWQHTLTPSGFINPVFKTFITKLLDSHAPVHLACLAVNKKAVGYLVLLADNKRVSFYLSAIDRARFAHINIGLLLHHFSLHYYASHGYESYDFLLGDYQIKKSLANETYDQQMLSFFKPNLLAYFELKAIDFKKYLKTNVFSNFATK